SSEPSGSSTTGPNTVTIRPSASVPGATARRASSSASITGTPRARSRAATALFPDAIPPVSPKRCTRRCYTAYRDRVRSTTVSRRRLLRAALVPGAVSAISGAVALVRGGGYARPEGAALASLGAAHYAVVRDAASRICAADAPGVVSADDAGVARFVDAYV